MIYDISPVIHPGLAVWPEDVPFSMDTQLRIRDGAPVNLASIRLSLHTGAHADAPLHFLDNGAAIDRVDLSRYLGPAEVCTLITESSIEAETLAALIARKPERVLLRTRATSDPAQFPRAFAYLSEPAAHAMGMAGVRLFGTDAPSVDAFDSQDLPAHKTLAQHGIAILENLVLEGVPDGRYELIALPLRIAGADASPLRAVLRTLGS